MNIQSIVEGHGEVSAVPVLLRRMQIQAAVWDVGVNAPIRRKRSQLVQQESLRQSVQLALLQENCGAILIIFDSDKDCPKELASQIEIWAREEARSIPITVVMPKEEFEAWFLASMESLRGHRGIRDDAEPHPDPEMPRDAKSLIEEQMIAGNSYMVRADQPAFTDLFDMSAAYRRCRSFRKMTSAFGVLLDAMGHSIPNWPPPAWLNFYSCKTNMAP